MKILVVDDSPLERTRIQAALLRLGHEVWLASDGEEAVRLYDAKKPDIVLLDVVMPIMDGLETARQIRRRTGRWVPIIFISSNTGPADIAAGIDAGGDDYLTKPVDSVVLAAKVQAMQRIANTQALLERLSEPSIRHELSAATEVDSLTGLATEQAGRRMLAREFSRCSRTMQPISLILVSLDQAAAPASGTARRKVAIALQNSAARISDVAACYGDGEFCAILPDTPMTSATQVADRLRRTVQQLPAGDGEPASAEHPLTVSVGLATAVPHRGSDSKELFSAADRMLRRALHEGGNRIESTAIDAPFRLTQRELECLQWSAVGKSSHDIASILGISESAVNFHMANIRHKFEVNSRRQAVAQAIHYGLIHSA